MIVNELERIYKEEVVAESNTVSQFVWRDWGKLRKTSVRIAGVPAKTGTKYLLDTSLDHYRYSNLYSAIVWTHDLGRYKLLP
jgi:hypothetical protein